MLWLAKVFSRKYLNINDLRINPAFYQPHCGDRNNTRHSLNLNRWCHFWNLIGARNRGNKYFHICVVCGVPIKKGTKKYRVCTKHKVKYCLDVKAGRVAVPATFEVYAVA